MSKASLPITVTQVTKRYGKTFALDNVTLNVRSGEFLTLLGPSGSGKTTLLNVMAGFVRPDSGSLQFGEREMIHVPPHKREIGMVFQNYALFPHMSVNQNIAFPLKLRGIKGPAAAEKIAHALEMVRLAGFGERSVDELSGGQRQRIALARAMVFEPRIMLMDEPLSALDKQLREHMQIELRALHDQLGMTTIYVTHDQREALTMSDRIAVIQSGQIMQLDTPQMIYQQPANRFVAEFIGESSFIPVLITNGQVRLGGQILRTTQGEMPEGRQWLMLRPERLRLLALDQVLSDDFNPLNVIFIRAIYQGDSSLLEFVLPEGGRIHLRQITTGVAAQPHYLTGQQMRLAVAVHDTVIVNDHTGEL